MEQGQGLAAEMGLPPIHQAPGTSSSSKLRVVHISDTHSRHWEHARTIPDGDVLIHSGDFGDVFTDEDYHRILKDLNEFFGSLPHKHKILVAGNHDARMAAHSAEETRGILTNAVYLQDSEVTIDGVRIYGTPWSSFGVSHGGEFVRGFFQPREELHKVWARVPEAVDILVTHVPPFNVLDLAWVGSGRGTTGTCPTCGREHPTGQHWGSESLYEQVTRRIKPKYHLFGHVHDEVGVREREGVVFCNAAMDIFPQPVVFDIETRSTTWSLQGDYVIHRPSGLVLDIDLANPNEGARVQLWRKLDPPRKQQQWRADGRGALISHLSSLAVACDGAGGPVTARPDGSEAQSWRFAGDHLRNGLGWCLCATPEGWLNVEKH